MREYRFSGFADGLNNVAREDQIPSSALRTAQNVDLLVNGQTVKPKRRTGREKVFSGSGMHSIYARDDFVLAVDNNQLKLWTDFAAAPTVLATVAGEVVYTEINNEIVWSDGVQLEKIDSSGTSSEFGVSAPTSSPQLTAITDGGLFEGYYQAAVTFVRDYQESGSSIPVGINVSEGSGFRLTNIPQPDSADGINLYVSQANGETLYFRTTLPVGTNVYDFGFMKPRRALKTFCHDRLPASTLMAFYNGMLFSARGNVLYASQPLNFSQYHTTEGYILLAAEANLLLAGENGMFVGADAGVYFFGGERFDQFSATKVSAASIPGAGVTVDGEFITPQLQGQTVAIWWTVDGVMTVGMPDGSVEPVRSTEFRVPDAERGVMAPVVREGTKQVVSLMKNSGTKSPMAFSDDMTIEVHKHGVA